MKLAIAFKKALLDKGIKQKDFAEMLGYKNEGGVYNVMSRDTMTLKTAGKWAEVLDCEIVLRDKITGKIYD